MNYIALATEDELSETVGKKIISETSEPLNTSLLLRKNGFGYLKSNVNNLINMSKITPVIMLTDLDNNISPKKLKDDWIKIETTNNFIFRVAVKEIESWLLADHDGIKTLLGEKVGRLPEEPDLLQNPKGTLIALSKKAPKKIRDEIVPLKGAISSQGIGYNSVMCHFVNHIWCKDRAANRSQSLKKAIIRIEELSKRLNK